MMLYRFVDQQKATGFPVECICDVAGVSRSAYYHWKRHRGTGSPPSRSSMSVGWSKRSTTSGTNPMAPTALLE